MRFSLKTLLLSSTLFCFVCGALAVWAWDEGILRLGPPRMQLVKLGMTISEVEGVLGQPKSTMPIGDLPGEEYRAYSGDGHNTINIRFKDGIAIHIQEFEPRRNWIPVG